MRHKNGGKVTDVSNRLTFQQCQCKLSFSSVAFPLFYGAQKYSALTLCYKKMRYIFFYNCGCLVLCYTKNLNNSC